MTTYEDFRMATKHFLTNYGMDNLNRDYLSDDWHMVYVSFEEFLEKYFNKAFDEIMNSSAAVNIGMVGFMVDNGISSNDDTVIYQYLQSFYLYGFEESELSSFKLINSIKPFGSDCLLLALIGDGFYYECGYMVDGIYTTTTDCNYVFPDGYRIFYAGRHWGGTWNIMDIEDMKLVIKFIDEKMYASLVSVDDIIADGEVVFGMM